MQTSSHPGVHTITAAHKRIFFVVAALAFWLCFLLAATPVIAQMDGFTMQSPVFIDELLAGMATWHG